MAVAQATKTVKKASSSTAKKPKTTPSHPPYIDMITEALVALKERTGSSHYAIAKHIEEQQKVKDLSPNFKKLLSTQLKKLVASGKLVKVKNSFKLPSKTAASATADKPKPKPKAKAATGAAAAKKKQPAKEATNKAVNKQKVAVNLAVKVAKSPAKKVAPVKAKKPKSIKSPVKKATAVKKTAAMKKAKTKK